MTNADHIEALFDYAADKPEGFTNAEAAEDLGINLDQFNKAVNGLRQLLDGDSINLICDPAGQSTKWIYKLVGHVDAGSPWLANRLRDSESRFSTLGSVTKSLVNATDGRTVEGRKARVMHKAVSRLREDLADLDAWGA